MAFNIFGRPKQNDIRVGYIDPDGGFIDGLTICDANIHAKRKRIKAGSGEKMRKPGTKGAPTAKAFRKAAKTAKKRK